ncbi:uncharacterized protein BP5553_01761 [Venustampulla echinocandica]|uniref:Uncharacterized protein n=1 Tax=Venustampulla echinocandica TaxID=2656787 RepID=A0A370U1Y0_9HELO|nr:uncharacterized protein BP5553_01761 [Venustampulla echinocandica]RDL41782.1 hypothetical protein BP5553_01761 [Venustampulla echinocandica]
MASDQALPTPPDARPNQPTNRRLAKPPGPSPSPSPKSTSTSTSSENEEAGENRPDLACGWLRAAINPTRQLQSAILRLRGGICRPKGVEALTP